MNFFLIFFFFGLSLPGISENFSSLIGLPEAVILSSRNEDSNTSTEGDNGNINNDSAKFDNTEECDIALLELTTEKILNFSAESYEILRESLQSLQGYLKKLSSETSEEEKDLPEIHDCNVLGTNEPPVLTHPDILNEGNDLGTNEPPVITHPNILNEESKELPRQPESKETERNEKAFNDKNEFPTSVSDIPGGTATQPLHREDVKIKLMLGISLLTLILFLIFMCISCFTFSQVQKKRVFSIRETRSLWRRADFEYGFKKKISIKPELAVMSYFRPAEGVSETSFSKSAASSTFWGPASLDFKRGSMKSMNMSEVAATVPFLHEMDAECMKLEFDNEPTSVEAHSMEIPSEELPSAKAEDS
ncbi:equatorin [Dromiciops gliroides]|uniref:equatorin n=1 Tax=Dromiciops gliroides TaxID=33562 RepID=UPI001CC68E9D|nr:equatorin [Dromiciops gliroides]